MTYQDSTFGSILDAIGVSGERRRAWRRTWVVGSMFMALTTMFVCGTVAGMYWGYDSGVSQSRSEIDRLQAHLTQALTLAGARISDDATVVDIAAESVERAAEDAAAAASAATSVVQSAKQAANRAGTAAAKAGTAADRAVKAAQTPPKVIVVPPPAQQPPKPQEPPKRPAQMPWNSPIHRGIPPN